MTTSSDQAAFAAEARFCAACGTALTSGAGFCHRCGTPAGQGVLAAPVPQGKSMASVLPWGLAFVALLALVATFAARNFSSSPGASDGSESALPAVSLNGGGMPTAGSSGAPDIGSLSPSERASRLYNRIMAYAGKGSADSVQFFAPMAMASHEMLQNPSIDERFHYGQIAQLTGNAIIARAQADTILAAHPRSLLGLLLASHAALMIPDVALAHTYDRRFLDAMASELATNNQDYTLHRAEIDNAAAELRRSGK